MSRLTGLEAHAANCDPQEAGFELLWLEAQVRGTLMSAKDVAATVQPAIKADGSGQMFLVIEGKRTKSIRASLVFATGRTRSLPDESWFEVSWHALPTSPG